MSIPPVLRADRNAVRERLDLPSRPARLYRKLADDRVQCFLCPRNCTLSKEKYGFCNVRKNEHGELVTLNYGVSVQLTEEVIETEACFHFHPGARILSLGNIGCMMTCEFCQNWATSQAAFVQQEDIRRYTPEQVVETALAHGINVLSWTYNDPVVWHEFVLDTARLARKHGMLNLYKSAFYIGPEAVDELHEVIDIFSLSLKSMDPAFYMKMTKARLDPVLDAIRQVHGWGDRHLEISNLMVTGANDNLAEAGKVAAWMLKDLGADVPLHFVRFHPAFRYLGVPRTDVEFLKSARRLALDMGMKHVYLGNVFEVGDWSNTSCAGCGAVLVNRFGLRATTEGLDEAGNCRACGARSPIVLRPPDRAESAAATPASYAHRLTHFWTGDTRSGHVDLRNVTATDQQVLLQPDLRVAAGRTITLRPGEPWRFLASKEHADSPGMAVCHPEGVEAKVWEVLDRAHFPTALELRS